MSMGKAKARELTKDSLQVTFGDGGDPLAG